MISIRISTVSTLIALLAGLAVSRDGTTEAIRKGLDAIKAEDAMAHVNAIASKEFEGRDTATPGCEKAAQYLCQQFEKIGLEPFGDAAEGKRGYLQNYPLSELGMDEGSGLTIVAESGTETLVKYREGVVTLTPGIPRNIDEPAPIVDGGAVDFTKDASAAPEASREPLKLDLPATVKGAFVVLKIKGYEGLVPNEMSRKLAGVKAAGAVGAILVPGGEAKDYESRFRQAQMNVRGTQLRPGTASGPAPLRRSETVPMLLFADVKLAEGLVGSKAKWIVNSKATEKSAANVVGLIRGSDPKLSNEYVIHSAHYDHVGRRGENIFYGADDNASGTTAVLEIAKAYKSTAAPRRSVILLLVSGEERGLWGSDYFAKNPPVPLTSIVGDINTDMVGRSQLNGKVKPEYMLMTPSVKHPKFNSLAKRALELGETYGMPNMPSGDIYWQRSDHYNFSKNGIPVMFLCNGEHEDYHRHTDTADKIDPDKIARSAKLAFHLGYEVAMDDQRPHDIAPESKPASSPESRPENK